MNDGVTGVQGPGEQQPQSFEPGGQFPPQAVSATPAYGYPHSPAEPDWLSMADEHETAARRRKRLLAIGGGVLAVAAIAGIVATTLAVSGKKEATPAAAASPNSSPSPGSSTSSHTSAPPSSPLDVISSVGTDKASVSLGALFPNPTVTVQGRTYTKTATDLDKDCTPSSLSNGLDQVLKPLGCYNVYRATYSSTGGLEITVGVVTFPSASRATKAKADGPGMVTPLVKDQAPRFCQSAGCATTRNSLGRYAYFTIAGPADGKAVPDKGASPTQAGKDIASSVYDNLLERGRTGLAKLSG